MSTLRTEYHWISPNLNAWRVELDRGAAGSSLNSSMAEVRDAGGKSCDAIDDGSADADVDDVDDAALVSDLARPLEVDRACIYLVLLIIADVEFVVELIEWHC